MKNTENNAGNTRDTGAPSIDVQSDKTKQDGTIFDRNAASKKEEVLEPKVDQKVAPKIDPQLEAKSPPKE